jgi:four helix bundle protein
MGIIKHFTDLDTWKMAHRVVLLMYKITKNFPEDEKFCLVSQMRRAAISVTSNIAEGFGRSSSKEKKHFYSISKGSLMELESQLLVAQDLGYVKSEEVDGIKDEMVQVAKLLSGLSKTAFDTKN